MFEFLSGISLNIISAIIYEKLDEINYDKRIDKKLRRIISISAKATISKLEKDLFIRERISKDLIDLIVDERNLSKLEIERLFEDALNDSQISNHDPKLLTENFLAKLLAKIFSDNELRNALSEISSINTGLKIDVILNQNASIKDNNSLILTKVMEILELIKNPLDKMDIIGNKANLFNSDVDSLILHQTINKSIPQEFVRYYEKPLFLESDENIKLSDVYIVPKYIITDFPARNLNLIRNDIVQFINDFVESKLIDKKYYTCLSEESRRINLLFIKGMPGNGKSSLFYHLSYKKMYDTKFLPNYKIHFIKFIDLFKEYGRIDCDNPLVDILDSTGQNTENLKNTVFILDGLDEICAVKGIDIELLCENLIESLTKYSNVKAIITTRLNYVNINQTNNRNVINIKLLGLNDEDKMEWITKFFSLKKSEDLKKKAESNVDYLKHLEDKNLVELLSIPLIFYMISATGIEINELNNIGELYDRVFSELFNRSYNDSTLNTRQKHGVYKEISVENARRVAQVIAYEMYTTNKTLLPISNSKIQNALREVTDEELKSKHKRKIEKLFLLTFFFKENEDIVEFAHKSIMEFFTAEYLINEMLIENTSIVKSIFELLVKQPVSLEVMTFIKYKFGINRSNRVKLDIEEFVQKFVIQVSEFISKSNAEQYNLLCIEKLEEYIAFLRLVLYLGDDVFKCDISKVLFNNSSVFNALKISLTETIHHTNRLLYNEIVPFILRNSDFTNQNFNGLSFTNGEFNQVTFKEASFDRVFFSDYTLENCSFKQCTFQTTTFSNLLFNKCTFDNSIFEVNLKDGLCFKECNFINLEKVVIFRQDKIVNENMMCNCKLNLKSIKQFIDVFILSEPIIIINQDPILNDFIYTLESYKADKLRQEREFGHNHFKIDIKKHYELNIAEIGNYSLEGLDRGRIRNPIFIYNEE